MKHISLEKDMQVYIARASVTASAVREASKARAGAPGRRILGWKVGELAPVDQ